MPLTETRLAGYQPRSLWHRCFCFVGESATSHSRLFILILGGNIIRGTSCVRTSPPSASSASSTPITTSASNAFPSSSNSSTLSESAHSTLDNPCKSPDCSSRRRFEFLQRECHRIHALAYPLNMSVMCTRLLPGYSLPPYLRLRFVSCLFLRQSLLG